MAAGPAAGGPSGRQRTSRHRVPSDEIGPNDVSSTTARGLGPGRPPAASASPWRRPRWAYLGGAELGGPLVTECGNCDGASTVMPSVPSVTGRSRLQPSRTPTSAADANGMAAAEGGVPMATGETPRQPSGETRPTLAKPPSGSYSSSSHQTTLAAAKHHGRAGRPSSSVTHPSAERSGWSARGRAWIVEEMRDRIGQLVQRERLSQSADVRHGPEIRFDSLHRLEIATA